VNFIVEEVRPLLRWALGVCGAWEAARTPGPGVSPSNGEGRRDRPGERAGPRARNTTVTPSRPGRTEGLEGLWGRRQNGRCLQ
jgi:hypothetical protein